MAKKTRSRGRVASHNATTALTNYLEPITGVPLGNQYLDHQPRVTISPQSDRRFYNPTRTISSPAIQHPQAARIKVTGFPKQGHRERLTFSLPKRVEICLRRNERKRVLHALRKTGKVGQRKPRRNFWSAISCKG